MIIDPYTWQRFAIEAVSQVADNTVAVSLKRPPGYTFRAGQYAVVRITKHSGEQYIRQYSFSSAQGDDTLELLIQREPEGAVSNWFCDGATYGDVVELSQPLGNFTLEKSLRRPVLCIAGRIGIAPFISMMRSTKRAKISVLYSVRNADQICFPELMKEYHASIICTDTSPRIGQKSLQKLVADNPIVYICGSKQFVDSMTSALRELKVADTDIKRELFTLQ